MVYELNKMSSIEFSKNTAGDFEFQDSKDPHNGVSSGITARLGISRSCEQKCDYVPPPLSTYLLLVIKFEFLKSTKFLQNILKFTVHDSSAVTVPGYQAFWMDTWDKLTSEYQQLIGQFPVTDARLKQLFKVTCVIEKIARYTPASVGESEQWSSNVSTAVENRQDYCKVLTERTLFSVLYGMCTVALHELKAVLKASTPASQSKTPTSAATQ
jgi:hypothetical protein